MSKASNKSSVPSAKKRPKRQSSSAKPQAHVSLPGYMRFTKDTFLTLVQNRPVFLRLMLLAWVISLLVVGTAQHSYYYDLSQSTDEVTSQLADGAYKKAIEVGALFVSITSGAANSTLTESQQIFVGAIYLFLWLLVVWLLRHMLSGNTVNVRDALYNASSPVVSTMLVLLVALIQLLPFALVVALFAAVISGGVLSGVGWVLLGVALVLLVGALSLYWLAGTLFAAIVVTIPGTYPWAALRSARQLIAGHRGKVLLRLLWLGLVTFVATLAIMLPVILFDALIGYSASFFVTLVFQLVSVSLFVYGAAYIYLLYRGIIDERS